MNNHLRIHLGACCTALGLLTGCSCTPEAYEQAASKPPQENRRPTPSATPTPSARPKPSPSASRPSPSASASSSSVPPASAPASSQPSQSGGGANSSQPGGGGEGASSGLAGAVAEFFGGGKSKGGASDRRSPAGPARTPQEAARDAQKLIDEAQQRFAADDPSAALGAGIAAYDLLAPHPGNAACQGLMKSLEADLRRYSEAAELLPISTAKPSRIR